MRVLAPLDNVGEVEQLIRAGADEFYCSVLSPEWTQKYSIAAISRRPALICNLKSFKELKGCIDIAHFNGVSVRLALNEHYYTQEQIPFLLEYIHEAIKAGVDAFIIADIMLLLLFKKQKIGKKIYISTGGTVFNSESANFYKNLGASGITMPRHLTIDEIRKIVRNTKDLETSVFIFNSRCPNIDGFCSFMHIESSDPDYKNACILPYSVSLLNVERTKGSDPEQEDRDTKYISACVRQQVWQRFHIDDYPCGLCALFEFHEMGITSVKIVGRGNPVERKVKDLRLIREQLVLLEEGTLSKEEFRKKARNLYMNNYQRPCRTSLCYYPEVMIDKGI